MSREWEIFISYDADERLWEVKEICDGCSCGTWTHWIDEKETKRVLKLCEMCHNIWRCE